eukprot:gnl/TRDRNA2_/TRDRNA2_130879_c0_seq2.p1 gnl/TRDRNA2_/TRDRNA2_130879_c0~~gnl/TRDRNA2_/TRDRNA2_130879_c0_seq2.p1  ORF type:complete len:745 (+),score=135.37 gnl/TRDRNA2_/TRDRNA2_130879_c0_seq2:124-2358(+)
MSDALVPCDSGHALVLARGEHDEQQLALFDESGKRKGGKWSSSVAKKGRRFGLPEDRPFKPLPYIDLPVGLSEAEVDQFLREQRLEDLHRKIQMCQLEEVDPDIRPPSPPPVYDRAGNRLNTREIRVRKSMIAEYNRLIRYMIKTVEGYTPPPDWRPQRLVKKIIIPFEKYPTAPFMGVIIGARGVNHKRLQEASGCRIFIRGREVENKWQNDEEAQMPQHVHIEADTEDQILVAEGLINPLLNPESPEFEYARTYGMQQVAIVNGFTLSKQEIRCGVCGALGHLGFECPETDAVGYKMANVVCSICGDKGHVASDCKVKLEQHKKENVDWKEEAEKKANLEAEYRNMMEELGLGSMLPPEKTPLASGPKKVSEAEGAGVGAAQRLLGAQVPGKWKSPAPAPWVRPAANQAKASTMPPGNVPAGPVRPQPRFVPPGPAVAALPAPVQVPKPVGPVGTPRAVAGQENFRPAPKMPAAKAPWHQSQPQIMQPRPPMPRAPVPWRGAPNPRPWAQQMRPWSNDSWSQQAPRPVPAHQYQAPAPSRPLRPGDPDTDSSIMCPWSLVERLNADPGILREMSWETGAELAVETSSVVRASSLAAGGGRRVLIRGTVEARNLAKTHFQAWLDVNSRSLAGNAGAATPPPAVGFPPGMTPPPSGFPPGAAPGVAPPMGFPPGMEMPPMGFPPGMEPPPTGFPPGMDLPPDGFPPGMDLPPAGFPPGFVDPGVGSMAVAGASSTGWGVADVEI